MPWRGGVRGILRYTRLVDDYASRSGLFAERLSALVNRVLASYDEDKYGLLLSQHHELFTEVLKSRGRQPLDALHDLLEQAVLQGIFRRRTRD